MLGETDANRKTRALTLATGIDDPLRDQRFDLCPGLWIVVLQALLPAIRTELRLTSPIHISIGCSVDRGIPNGALWLYSRGVNEAFFADLSAWLTQAGLAGASETDIVSGFCDRGRRRAATRQARFANDDSQ